MKDKKLTLMICNHQHGRHIPRLLEDIFDQTLDPSMWKLLMIHDECTDRSAEIFEEAWGDLCAIRGVKTDWIEHDILIKEKKSGHNGAKNYGFKVIDTFYVAYQDCDDGMLPQRLELQLDFLERNRDIDALFTQAWDKDGHGRLYVNCFDINQYVKHEQIVARLPYENVLMNGSFMGKMDALRDINFYEEGYRHIGKEDWVFWQRMADAGKKFHKLNERLCVYSLSTSTER